jgi:hypothetical protein
MGRKRRENSQPTRSQKIPASETRLAIIAVVSLLIAVALFLIAIGVEL